MVLPFVGWIRSSRTSLIFNVVMVLHVFDFSVPVTLFLLLNACGSYRRIRVVIRASLLRAACHFFGGTRVVLRFLLPEVACHFFGKEFSLIFLSDEVTKGDREEKRKKKRSSASFLWTHRSHQKSLVSPGCGGRGYFSFSIFSQLIHPLSRRRRCRRPPSASLDSKQRRFFSLPFSIHRFR